MWFATPFPPSACVVGGFARPLVAVVGPVFKCAGMCEKDLCGHTRHTERANSVLVVFIRMTPSQASAAVLRPKRASARRLASINQMPGGNSSCTGMERGASSGTLWAGVLEAMMTSTASFVVRPHCTLNANMRERCLWNACFFSCVCWHVSPGLPAHVVM